MSTFLLIRHADTDAVGRFIAGRGPGVPLNANGRVQLGRLVQRVSALAPTALYCSPLERTRETAAPLAAALALELHMTAELNEIDFGEWTGRTFAELEPDPLWRRYNLYRSVTRIPGGEVMSEVQDRAVAFVQMLRERHENEVVALVTHGDVIRATLAYYLGLAMDMFLRVEIDPASITAIRLDDGGPHVLYVNAT